LSTKENAHPFCSQQIFKMILLMYQSYFNFSVCFYKCLLHRMVIYFCCCNWGRPLRNAKASFQSFVLFLVVYPSPSLCINFIKKQSNRALGRHLDFWLQLSQNSRRVKYRSLKIFCLAIGCLYHNNLMFLFSQF
jgi:hypothetical protein